MKKIIEPIIAIVIGSILAYYFGLTTTRQYLLFGLIIVGVYSVIHCASKGYSKSRLKHGIWPAVPLGVALWFGTKLDYGSTEMGPFSLFDILVVPSLIVVMLAMIMAGLAFIDKRSYYPKVDNSKGKRWLYALIIIACYLPLFLAFFPGLVSNDSAVQLNQAVGNTAYSNWHPVLHTLFIALPVNIGLAISGDLTMGIALSTVLQMIILAGIFAYVVDFAIRITGKKWIGYALMVFFAICPIVACYSIVMWKDVLFAAFFLLLAVKSYDFIKDRQRDSEIKLKDVAVIVGLAILVAFFRNGGIVIVIALLLGFLIYYRKARKMMTVLLVSVTGLILLVQGPIFTMLGVVKSPFMESMSVVAQQIGYVVQQGNLDEEERNSLAKYADVEKLADSYNPMNADSAKGSFSYSAVEDDKLDFVEVWARIGLSHFGDYMKAYILQTYSYWYPQGNTWVIDLEHNHEEQWLTTGYNDLSLIGDGARSLLKSVEYRLMNSIWLGWIGNVGVLFWAIILLVVVFLYQKRYEMMLIVCPILVYMVSLLIASPVSMMYRYVYLLLVVMPVLLIICFIKNKKKGEVK